MQRRDFLKGVSAAGLLSMLDPAYLQAKEQVQSGVRSSAPLPKRPFGRSGEQVSIIGFGGIVVKEVTPTEAANYVSESVDRGVNYFDVAPTYGNAQERLGPALKPYRDQCFLACKTRMRTADEARKELEESLRLLQTDHVDLYQLHAITTVEEVEQAFAPGGAMETFRKAQQEGKIRYLGFSAHDEAAAHAAFDRHDFDSVLFPLGFPTWIKEGFGPSVHKRAREADRALLAIKAMARGRWPGSMKRADRPWSKTWYEPFDELDKVSLGLRFTYHLPAHVMIPPGHWELFSMAMDLAQSGALTPLNENEEAIVEALAMECNAIFPKK